MDNYGINRLLSEDELKKLTSTDGIIELLCGIENFKSDDYDGLNYETQKLVDYTMNIKLLSNKQITGNLRRSFDAGNIALINNRELTALALLYFGVKDENGRYVKYICPYTGKEYNIEDIASQKNKSYADQDLDKVLELEHIMPHSSGGGTVLFNCIPASREANSTAEKGNLHLLDWLTNQQSSGIKYYSDGGKQRLEKLVKYMLSAYEIAFNEYVESDIQFEYDAFENAENNEVDIEQGILNVKLENPKKVSRNKKIIQTQIEGYIPFCGQLIEKLKDEGVEVSKLEEQLSKISGDINIEKYRTVQKVIEELFEQEDKKSYLTYGLNVDYVKLVNSIDANDSSEIRNILSRRFNEIKKLVDDNGKSIVDYFISLRDIEDINLLYKQEPNEEEIQNFVDNIKLGFDGKVSVFIDMLGEEKYTKYSKGRPDDNNIFSVLNPVSFKGYENIEGLNTSHFWSDNSQTIKKRLEWLLSSTDKTKEEKLKRAERAIDCYEVTTNKDNKKIDCYIEMLGEKKYTSYSNGKPDEYNIFSQRNKVQFKGYKDIDGLNTSQFWSDNSQTIKKRLEWLLSSTDKTKEEKLKRAERAIDCYEVTTNKDNKKIDCYIEMLGEKKYTSYSNGKPDEYNIFSQRNKVQFKGYKDIDGLNTSHFWSNNSQTIKKRLEELLSSTDKTKEEERKKLEKAERAIDCFEFTTNKDNKKIDCYIEMLGEEEYTNYNNKGKPDDKNIFSVLNPVPFKGYENIEGLNTSYFWRHHSTQIISLLFYNKNYKGPEYNAARNAILKYKKVKNIDEYIEKEKNEKNKNTLISIRENTQDLTMSGIEKVGRVIQSAYKAKGVDKNGHEQWNENSLR